MEYEYWGYVERCNDGICAEKLLGNYRPSKIDPALLPDWIKTKIAMLDLMGDRVELPCESYKVIHEDATTYFLFTEASSAREEDE